MTDDRLQLEARLAAAIATQDHLEEKRGRAAAELERLERVKRPLVMAAACEGNTKQAQLDKLNAKILEQRLRVGDFDTAIAQAGAEVEAAERAIADADGADQRAEIAMRYAELRELDRRFDQRAAALSATVAERKRLIVMIQQVAGKRLPGMNWLAGRGGKGVLTRALKAAGLTSEDLDLGFTGSVRHDVPLSRLTYPEVEALIGDVSASTEEAEAA